MTRPWCCLLALAAFGCLARGAEGDDDPVPRELTDAGFRRYADLDLLRAALTDRDPALLCDAALQLAEGERVLLRSHKGLPSRKVFLLAVECAADKRDGATLKRLLRGAKAQPDKGLAEVVEVAMKTAGVNRKVERDLVPPDGMSDEALVGFRGFIEQIKLATSLNDGARLDQLEKQIPGLPQLEERNRSGLRRLIREAKKDLPARPDDGDDLLRKLRDSARSKRGKARSTSR
jgi:hypothetical protein